MKGVPFDQVKIVSKKVAQCRKNFFPQSLTKLHGIKVHSVPRDEFFSENSHCVEKRKRGEDPLGAFLSSSCVEEIKLTHEGIIWRQKKFGGSLNADEKQLNKTICVV